MGEQEPPRCGAKDLFLGKIISFRLCVLVLAVMLALATPFGTFVADAVKSTTQGLFDVNQNALNSTGLINIGDQSFGEGGNGGQGGAGDQGGTEQATEINFIIVGANYKGMSNMTWGDWVESDYNSIFKLDGDYVYYEQYGEKKYFGINGDQATKDDVLVADGVYIPHSCPHTETEIRNVTAEYSGDTCCKNCDKVITAGQTVKAKIPEGGLYTAVNGTVYNPGDEFPEVVSTGDKYQYNGYIYKYNQYCVDAIGNTWNTDNNQNGWGVLYSHDSTTPGAILENIANAPVTTMYQTFYQDNHILTAPAIPSTVTNMYHAFANCTSLKTAPDMSKATKVTNLAYAFFGCSSLTDISGFVLPVSANNVQNMFYNCTRLKGTITVKATALTSYSNCFAHTTEAITLVGTGTNNDVLELLKGTNYNPNISY